MGLMDFEENGRTCREVELGGGSRTAILGQVANGSDYSTRYRDSVYALIEEGIFELGPFVH